MVDLMAECWDDWKVVVWVFGWADLWVELKGGL